MWFQRRCCLSAFALRPRLPVLRQCYASQASKGSAAVAEVQEKKRVILTFSGKVLALDGSELWNRLAKVMSIAGANIETCGGTFVQMQNDGDPDAEQVQSFSVSAFGACISPAVFTEESTDDTHLGCTMFVKAILPADRVQTLMKLLQTESPAQVYTASLSSAEPKRSSLERCLTELGSHQQNGTLHLFGVDRSGQLAKITEILTQFGVSVSNLHVQSGSADSGKCDFVPCPTGGPLAENRVRIRFDTTAVDITRLRKEIQRVGEDLGYAVTCLTLDSHAQFRTFTPSYLLRRRAFVATYLMETRISAKRLLRRPIPYGRRNKQASSTWLAASNAMTRQPPVRGRFAVKCFTRSRPPRLRQVR
mmetsp:Transcript_9599/g.22952  ORF Transcript_9599/g.22952 Transcript_9599/m.22952 type:complete len:363 (+) Transcript_9599:54-1142(+)